MTPALHIYAGPLARKVLAQQGLQPKDVTTLAGAAGGPKGLTLGALDRFIFGNWLANSQHPVDLVGASIGAWRMATACLNEPVKGFERLEHTCRTQRRVCRVAATTGATTWQCCRQNDLGANFSRLARSSATA